MNDKTKSSAHLIRAEVQNVLGIRLAEVKFDADGGLIVIGGENGAGKSSLLDALRWALDGVKPKGKEMLRHGADKGTVVIELAGEVIEIKRSVTEKGAYLKATGANGAEIKSPQKVLDALIGTFGIDPTEFLLMTAEQQAKRVQEVMGVDFSDLDAEHKRLFEERTIANRRVRDAEGELRNLPRPDGAPVEPVILSDLVAQLNVAEKAKRAHDDNVALLEEIRNNIVQVRADIEEKKKQLEQLGQNCAELDNTVNAESRELVDPAPLREKLKNAEAINALASAWKRRAEAEAKVKALAVDVDKVESEIVLNVAERASRIDSAPLTIEGVDIQDGAVYYNDAPLSEASDGQRLRVAFEIAAAGTPDARFLTMRHGSLLDTKNRMAVAELAIKRGYTVVMEVVGANGIDILIEDGVSK